MKIPVPQYVLKHDDWTDREMVLLSLLLYFYSIDYKLGVTYYMHSADIKRMVDAMNVTGPAGFDKYLDRLRRVLKIGMLSWDVWSVQFNPERHELSRNGRVERTLYDIQDVQAIGLFYYLAGRLTAPDIIKSDVMPLETDKYNGRKGGTVMDVHFANPIFFEDEPLSTQQM